MDSTLWVVLMFRGERANGPQAYALMPGTFEDVVELLIPELQRRGIFWHDYHVPGGTYRENLYESKGQSDPLPEHPAGKLIWRPSKKGVGFDDNVAQPPGKDEGDTTIDPASMQLG